MDEYFLSLLEKKPEPTALQKQIEMDVINGLGYDTRTQYVEKNPEQLINIVKDTQSIIPQKVSEFI